MFLAMPVPMQIYAKVNSGKHMECPITVRDGRNWLNAICKEKQIRSQEAEFFGKDAKEKLAKEEIILEAKDINDAFDHQPASKTIPRQSAAGRKRYPPLQ